MYQFGRLVLHVLCLQFMIISSSVAQDQIIFFTQSEQLVREQESFFLKKLGTTRSLVLLNGTYDLFDAQSNIQLGQVSLPSVFHHQHPLIFRKIFPKQDNPKAVYFLYLERLIGFAKIFINNQLIYEGSCNFLPLVLSVPGELLTRENNTFEVHLVPWSGFQDQFPIWFPINLPRIDNGSNGIIFLAILPEIAISDLYFRTNLDSESGIVEGRLMIYSPSALFENLLLDIQVFQQNQLLDTFQIQPVITSKMQIQKVPFKFAIQPCATWSPDKPVYYRMLINLRRENNLIDQFTTRLMFREVGIKNNQLYLNNYPYAWKGINYIYQDPTGVGLFDRKLIVSDLQQLKSRGFNLLRLAYYPQSEQFYHLTDSLGFLCLQDLPIPLLVGSLFSDSLRASSLFDYVMDFQKIVFKHPSVIGIGLGNFYIENSILGDSLIDSLIHLASSDQNWISYSSHFDHVILEKSPSQFGILEILDRNQPTDYLNALFNTSEFNFPLILSGLSSPFAISLDSAQTLTDLLPLVKLHSELMLHPMREKIAGELLFTFTDYILQTPSLQLGSAHKTEFQKFRGGLWNLERRIKPKVELILKGKWFPSEDKSQISSEKGIHTYLFIIVGIINLFIFLFLYRSLMEFRKNIFRSIRRPHGFFVELLERRLISYEQSFYLMLVISVNAAVMLGGLFYFFRNTLIMDYLISLILPLSIIKNLAVHIVWRPYLLIPVVAGLVIVVLLCLTLVLHIISFFRHPRIRVRQAVATSTWAASPFLLLLPFGMFFYNLLLVMKSYWILGIVLLYFHLWYFVRWLNGARVITVSSYTRVIVFTLFLGIFVVFGVYFLLYRDLTLTVHLKMLLQMFTMHL